MPRAYTRPTADIRVIAGGTADAATCRFGNTDTIEVRLLTETGDYAQARLPREAVSTPVDRTTLGVGELPVWDDLYLPPVGTPLHARPAANAGIERGYWVIDGSTLRPNT